MHIVYNTSYIDYKMLSVKTAARAGASVAQHPRPPFAAYIKVQSYFNKAVNFPLYSAFNYIIAHRVYIIGKKNRQRI